ncbi:MAG: 23S rRNA (pseudouridine(1915)-N(3))-methyltransferase RlmH [Opitutales bacterium]
MKHWYLVVAGRLKLPAARQWNERYRERLTPWLRLEVVELRDAGPAAEAVKQRPWLDRCPVGGIVLSERGKVRDSAAFATWCDTLPEGTVWLLGGADGFAPEIESQAGQACSLSPLTLPHDLARVVLLEQLYRAHAILHGHPYHREG